MKEFIIELSLVDEKKDQQTCKFVFVPSDDRCELESSLKKEKTISGIVKTKIK